MDSVIGQPHAKAVLAKALASGRTVPQVVLERGHLTAEELQRALSPRHLANLPALTAGEPDLLQ